MKLTNKTPFTYRHIGVNNIKDINKQLDYIKVESIEQLISETVPDDIRIKENSLSLPAISENDYLNHIKDIAAKNIVNRSFIGLGYYDTITPSVILRNVFENPGWYTQYTPYQSEIAQGRLEALLNFQTVVCDLTGLEIANASLLDEGTATAEAMTMMDNIVNKRNKKAPKKKLLIAEACFPNTIEVLKTRAKPLGLELKIQAHNQFELDDDTFGILLQYPANNGEIFDYSEIVKQAKEKDIMVCVAVDLLSLTLLTPPGEWGADIVVGNSQRFGVPLGYGGPHAAFFATSEKYKRNIPGRIIGVSEDTFGNPALRMALQTREQHIKREKATSNICTAQALLANMAGFYAIYHGPKGLKNIANDIHFYTCKLAKGLSKMGFAIVNEFFFDTVNIFVESEIYKNIRNTALQRGMNFRYLKSNHIGISLDQKTDAKEVEEILNIFAIALNSTRHRINWKENINPNFPDQLKRKTSFLQHETFQKYHSETEMMRYLKRLENKDLSLTHSMIPLGSCTMKLNAATELIPVSWEAFNNIHPFAPIDQTGGYAIIFKELEKYLSKITGFAACSLQPNSGAQGEFTGLMVIKAFHQSKGAINRNVVLIPSSAHGTNPASAVMSGFKVVVVKCAENGNIDLTDLKAKAEQYKDDLAAMMVTYPSTHGVFEKSIIEATQVIHKFGGKVYLDGANMNAQLEITNPGTIGADVCHLNLHKTFAIPHGGGGPGVGPICCTEELSHFLPTHSFIKTKKDANRITAVSSAPWGSASILLISYAFIKMLGNEGLRKVAEHAILNANYIKCKLEKHFDILYTGERNRVAHELILDFRNYNKALNITVEDIAKRLMDYGFHAPTVSFPVAGTMMIEPTESESLEELDKFCEAMIAIKTEINEIANETADPVDNVLKNAPHTMDEVCGNEWNHTYSREKAVFPLPWIKERKFWPSVNRVSNSYGDRNLICSCPPTELYEEVS